MTDQEINEAIARKEWKPSEGGWRRDHAVGYDWYRNLPIEDYCNSLEAVWRVVNKTRMVYSEQYKASLDFCLMAQAPRWKAGWFTILWDCEHEEWMGEAYDFIPAKACCLALLALDKNRL